MDSICNTNIHFWPHIQLCWNMKCEIGSYNIQLDQITIKNRDKTKHGRFPIAWITTVKIHNEINVSKNLMTVFSLVFQSVSSFSPHQDFYSSHNPTSWGLSLHSENIKNPIDSYKRVTYFFKKCRMLFVGYGGGGGGYALSNSLHYIWAIYLQREKCWESKCCSAVPHICWKVVLHTAARSSTEQHKAAQSSTEEHRAAECWRDKQQRQYCNFYPRNWSYFNICPWKHHQCHN